MPSREQRRSEKHRKRHAQKQARERARTLREVQTVDPPGSVSAPLPSMSLGRPGFPTELNVVPIFNPGGTEEEDRARLSDTREREFRVYVHLSSTITFSTPNVNISLDPKIGGSLLLAPKDVVALLFKLSSGHVSLHWNQSREVSGVEFKCRAHSREEALAFYSENVAPILDDISYRFDVPLYVASIAWQDELNQVTGTHCMAPYPQVRADGLTGNTIPPLRPFTALYREAITNPSVFYQYLCFSKILEGTFRVAVPNLFKVAASKGIDLTRGTPTVPHFDEVEADAAARAFEGKSIEVAFTSFLEPEFRHALAHFAEDGKEPLLVSSYVTGSRLEGALPLARVCARLAIGMMEKYIAQLPFLNERVAWTAPAPETAAQYPSPDPSPLSS